MNVRALGLGAMVIVSGVAVSLAWTQYQRNERHWREYWSAVNIAKAAAATEESMKIVENVTVMEGRIMADRGQMTFRRFDVEHPDPQNPDRAVLKAVDWDWFPVGQARVSIIEFEGGEPVRKKIEFDEIEKEIGQGSIWEGVVLYRWLEEAFGIDTGSVADVLVVPKPRDGEVVYAERHQIDRYPQFKGRWFNSDGLLYTASQFKEINVRFVADFGRDDHYREEGTSLEGFVYVFRGKLREGPRGYLFGRPSGWHVRFKEGWLLR